MKLRKVEIVGFKSFREKVTVEFSDGMTCIVGPNGCGKSNVVDAIKWAMGDTSAKSLRGTTMQDVIFAGSENFKQMSMAEVTLTFVNEPAGEAEDDAQTTLDIPVAQAPPLPALPGEEDDEGENAGDASEAAVTEVHPEAQGLTWSTGLPRELRLLPEVSVTRRLFRSGDSEYLINKTLCRLMDIQDLLAGTGLGKQGYSIIEQGEVGFIVSARPSQRRLLIEEASGITRYKTQRERAEKRLEKTELNLARVRDVYAEVEKQLKNLEHQARRAEEHRVLSEELRVLELTALLERRAQFAQQVQRAEGALGEARRESEALRRQMEQMDESLRSLKLEAHVSEQRAAEATEAYYKLDTRLNLTRTNREHAERSAQEAEERYLTATAEQQAQNQRRAHLDEEMQRIEAEMASFEESSDHTEDFLGEAQREVERLRHELDDVRRDRDEARNRLADGKAQVQRVEDRLAWVGSQISDMRQRKSALNRQVEGASEEVDDLRRSVNRLELDRERAQDSLQDATASVQSAQKKLDAHREELREAEQAMREVSQRRVTVQARLETLEAMRLRGEGYGEGVQKVLKWAHEQGRTDILGPAGNFLRVEDGWEAAASAYLGERLGDIVVTSRAAAFEALNMLAREKAGRVACYVARDAADPGREIGAWLEGLTLVESLEEVPADQVRSVRDDGGYRAWATRSGNIVFANGRVIGGYNGESAETVLRQARQIVELRVEFESLHTREQDATERLDLAQEDLVLAEDRLRNAQNRLGEATHLLKGIEQEHESEERQLARAQTFLQKLRQELAPVDQMIEGLQAEVEQLKQRQSEIQQQFPDLQALLVELDLRLATLQTALEDRQAELTSRQVHVAQAQERQRNLEQSWERLQGSIRHSEQQAWRFEREAAQQKERMEQLRESATMGAQELETLARDLADAQQAMLQAREKAEGISQRLQAMELDLLKLRRTLDEAQARLQSLELEASQGRSGLANLDEQLQERFEITLELAAQFLEESPIERVEPEKRSGRIDYLRRRLAAMGPVNAMAIEEFEETRERKAFLEEQQRDLDKALNDLRSAIARMDRESRKRFKETFDAVNQKFQTVFPRLFQGGTARLTLTDPDDLLHSGVDIEVQPPGKKLQNVNLLSGGEKALTAVSLIFSIFLLKPTPFAILDEVDAALDEANVGRFAEMVREMSGTSQMLVITHNRRTMEAPEVLYGVTMEEPGVSKVVAVRLSDLDSRMAS